MDECPNRGNALATIDVALGLQLTAVSNFGTLISALSATGLGGLAGRAISLSANILGLTDAIQTQQNIVANSSSDSEIESAVREIGNLTATASNAIGVGAALVGIAAAILASSVGLTLAGLGLATLAAVLGSIAVAASNATGELQNFTCSGTENPDNPRPALSPLVIDCFPSAPSGQVGLVA